MNKRDFIKSSRPYKDMKRFATVNELPLHFTDDLAVHDVDILLEYGPNKPFIWVLRENGTHFLKLEGQDKAFVVEWLNQFQHYFIDNNNRWFAYWTGDKWEAPATKNLEGFIKNMEYVLESKNEKHN